MENIFILYYAKVSIALSLFYILYLIFLTGDTFLRLRRYYFLFTIAYSLFFPFLIIQLKDPVVSELRSYWLPQIEIYANGESSILQQGTLDLLTVLQMMIFLGSVVLLSKFVYQLVSLALLRVNNKSERVGNYTIVELRSKQVAPFSFFNWIFIRANDDQYRIGEILAHEQIHVRQCHSADMVLAQLVCIAFWFNPLVWLLKRDMTANLEYLADKGVLDEGFDRRIYQYTLLHTSTQHTGMSFINNFNVSQLKKRITMMNKRKSSVAISVKYVLAIPLVFALLLGNAAQASSEFISISAKDLVRETDNLKKERDQGSKAQLKNNASIEQHEKTYSILQKTSTDEQSRKIENSREEQNEELQSDSKKKENVYKEPEIMPKYTGGEFAMMKYIGENLTYPKDAQEKKLEGRVVMRFVVKSTGEVANVELLRGFDAGCDAEAMRVVTLMPKWIPGTVNGNAVDTYYTLPILFRLKK